MLRELNLFPLWKRRDATRLGPVTADSRLVERPGVTPRQIPSDITHAAGSDLPAAVRRDGDVREIILPGSNEATLSNQHGDTATNGAFLRIDQMGWSQLKLQVRDCQACKLRIGCKQTVFGAGDEKAGWLFVGEGPGAEEDEQGEPFVGQAGKLLDNMLAAIKLKRGKNVYIANVVKCRPPGNRIPEADEIEQCFHYLRRQIALIQPRLIVALGKVASNTLLGRDATLASLRGKRHDFQGISLIVTYHPAYLLRSPADKAKAWHDLQLAARLMNEVG
jgi:uracil-DNA glycosylase family 4